MVSLIPTPYEGLLVSAFLPLRGHPCFRFLLVPEPFFFLTWPGIASAVEPGHLDHGSNATCPSPSCSRMGISLSPAAPYFSLSSRNSDIAKALSSPLSSVFFPRSKLRVLLICETRMTAGLLLFLFFCGELTRCGTGCHACSTRSSRNIPVDPGSLKAYFSVL